MKAIRVLCILLLAGFASSCAAPRASFQKTADIGTISSVNFHSESALQTGSAPIFIPIGGAMVPMKRGGSFFTKRTYLYAIRLVGGKIIQTQSDREFAVGDCVQLWHAGGVDAASDEFNFVQGTLESNRQCK